MAGGWITDLVFNMDEMRNKLFIATYFDNFKDALMDAAKKNYYKKEDIFEVITNGKGFFVVSKNVIKRCF